MTTWLLLVLLVNKLCVYFISMAKSLSRMMHGERKVAIENDSETKSSECSAEMQMDTFYLI